MKQTAPKEPKNKSISSLIQVRKHCHAGVFHFGFGWVSLTKNLSRVRVLYFQAQATYQNSCTDRRKVIFNGVYQHSVVFYSVQQCQKCSIVFNSVQQCSMVLVVFNSVQQCSIVFNSALQCSIAFNSVQQCSTVFNSVQQCSIAFNSFQQCSMAFKSVQQFTPSSPLSSIPLIDLIFLDPSVQHSI